MATSWGKTNISRIRELWRGLLRSHETLHRVLHAALHWARFTNLTLNVHVENVVVPVLTPCMQYVGFLWRKKNNANFTVDILPLKSLALAFLCVCADDIIPYLFIIASWKQTLCKQRRSNLKVSSLKHIEKELGLNYPIAIFKI